MDSKKQIFDHYNQLNFQEGQAKNSLRDWVYRHYPQLMIPELRFFRRLDRGLRVVELGAGAGHFISALEKMGFSNLEGVEFASGYPQRTRRIVQKEIFEYLAESADGSVDAVVMLDVLEHFPKAQMLQLLQAIQRALKPGGMLLVRVPNIMSITGKFNHYTEITHETQFTEATLYYVLTAQGFTNVKVYPSEKWVKIFVDPRRWIGGLFYLCYATFMFFWRLSFGGPKIHTLNVTACAYLPKPKA